MTVVSQWGHDLQFTTANRPTNAEPGMTGFDTTLQEFMVVNSSGAWVSVSSAAGQSTVAATGTNQGTAALLTSGFNVVTAADGTKGVILPVASLGAAVSGYNNSASSLLIYPATSGTINAGAANAGVTVAAHTRFEFKGVNTTDWAATYAAGGTYATLTGVETLTNKTLTTPTSTNNVGTVAAAGTNQGTATAITTPSTGFVWVTGADGTKGVVLPAVAAGLELTIKNDDAANAALNVYPAGTNTINALAASTSIAMAAKSCATFYGYNATKWFSSPTVPS